MNEDAYRKLAQVLDTIPNGFPSTESGVELKMLEKIFTPEEADLFCDMRLTYETAEQVAERTGRPLEGLEEKLRKMAEKGQLFEIRIGTASTFRMLPFIIGIYEMQLERMDGELVEMIEEYFPTLRPQLLSTQPQLVKTFAVEESIPNGQEALPYERVSTLIENGQSFRINQCICKKEQGMLGNPCEKPGQVCLLIAPLPGYFEQFPEAKTITRDEAYALLEQTEEAGLVHLASNIQSGQLFICNCCSCCCGVLRSISEGGIPASLVINSNYYALTDPEKCEGCGTCADERCQVNAIVEDGEVYRVLQDRCIGCGLCVSTCKAEAIQLVRKNEVELSTPPPTEDDWFDARGQARGVDFAAYK
jgi:electron transport complex protein RnfB